MKLGELLSPARVVVPLEARDLREATMRLARSLEDSGVVADPERFAALLAEEWPEDIVAVEGKAFLPHFRSDAFRQTSVALGVAPKPVRRGAGRRGTARIVVLVVAPMGEAAAYLRTMAAVARALQNDEVLAAMHWASSADELLAIPGLGDAPIPDDVTVADVMTTHVTSVGPDTTLAQAGQLLLERNVRAVPVTGPNGEVLGLLTDSHLLNHLLPSVVSALSTGQVRATRRKGRGKGAQPEDPGAIPVREVMDRSVLCLSEDQTVADVAALMLAKDVDRFPVTRDGALVGFLTRGDIIRKLLGNP